MNNKFIKRLLLLCLFYIGWNQLQLQAQNQWDIRLEQSIVDCDGNQVCYEVQLKSTQSPNWVLGDQNYRFFYDGDLIDIFSVQSLLPSTQYDVVQIDQNIKVSGQGQESASPLDNIDDNLGFLDFSIVLMDKSNPSANLLLNTNTFSSIAEICMDVAPSVFSDLGNNECLNIYHSRPITAGTFTNQYTVISENNAPNITIATTGMGFDDLTEADDPEDCPGPICNGPKEWEIQFVQSSIDCAIDEVCYELQLKSIDTDAWIIGDQNYRLFFDGDLMTVNSVISQLPANIYTPVTIEENIKISGQGQEAASPLDNIDDNLGFLDFNIIQLDKNNLAAATEINNTEFVPIAVICVTVDVAAFVSEGNDCLSFYISRAATAGTITNQHTTISENDEAGSTVATVGTNFKDMDSNSPDEACYSNFCQSDNDCIISLQLSEDNCCASCESGNLKVTTLHWNEENTNSNSANIARSKPSMFNGIPTLNSTNAYPVTDGKFAGDPFAAYDYGFSKLGVNNRWDIDLVGNYDLEEIRIFTKSGCCIGSADTYRVFVSSTPFYTTSLSVLLNDASLESITLPVIPGTTPSVTSLNISGRFVRVYLEGDGQMQLVEVEIIGSGNVNSSPYQYSWSHPDATAGSTTQSCLGTGLHQVTVTDEVAGCSKTASLIVD